MLTYVHLVSYEDFIHIMLAMVFVQNTLSSFILEASSAMHDGKLVGSHTLAYSVSVVAPPKNQLAITGMLCGLFVGKRG